MPDDTVVDHSGPLRIGLTQWGVTGDMPANVAIAVELVEQAGARGADLVLLPENALLLGTNSQMRDRSLPADAPEIGRLCASAKSAGCAVVLGGFKRLHAGTEVHNTALVIDATGEIAGGYDKIHLFDAVVAGRTFEASSVECRGETPVLLRTGGVGIGLTICYDVRFPELYRALALAGAQVFLVPAAFTATTGQAHWEPLLRARAIENAAYVIASATVQHPGRDNGLFPTYGHALAVDPWGTVLADLGDEQQAIRIIEVDPARVNAVRATLPVLSGVQPEAYRGEPRVIDVPRGNRQEAT